MSIKQFISYLQREKRYSPRTIILYEGYLKQFCAHESLPENGEGLEDVLPLQIRTWLADMLKSGNSSRTANLKICTLNRYYKYMMRTGKMTQNPVERVPRPKMVKRLPAFLDAKNLNAHIDSLKERDAEDYISQRNYMMLELLYNTGMRRMELLGLQVADVDMSGKIIRVRGKGDKSRELPLTNELLLLLKHYINLLQACFPLRKNNLLFVSPKGAPLYPEMINRVIKKMLANDEHLTGKKTPHVLRHSFATHLLNNGADLQSIKEVLGHANLAATQVYTHNSFKQLRKIYEKAHPLQ